MRQPRVILRGHSASTSCLHFADDEIIVSGDERGAVHVWNVSMEECVGVVGSNKLGMVLSLFPHNGGVCVQYKSGAVRRLAEDLIGEPVNVALGVDLGAGYATMCRAASHARGVLLSEQDAHGVILSGTDGGLRFNRPGKALLTSVTGWGEQHFLAGYEDGVVCQWDIRKEKSALCEVKIGKDGVFALCSAPAGNVAVAGTGGDSGTLCALGDYENRIRLLRTIHTSAGVSDLSWREDGHVLVSAGWDGLTRVWSGRRRPSSLLRPLSRLRWHAGGVRGVSFSPDGTWLATCGDDRTVAVWCDYVRERK